MKNKIFTKTSTSDAHLYSNQDLRKLLVPIIVEQLLSSLMGTAREFDTLKSKKVPQSLEIGLFFCQIFIFII